MAAYAPAGGILLAVGGTAAIVTHDAVLIAFAVTLLALGFGVGMALQRAGLAGDEESA